MIPLSPRDDGIMEPDHSCDLCKDMPINRLSALGICSSSVVLCIPIFSAIWPASIFQG